MPKHHPLPETLISFAAGTLPDSISYIVAAHLALCRECTEHVRQLEIVGGVMLDQLQSVPDDKTERAYARWAARKSYSTQQHETALKTDNPTLPPPLDRYLAGHFQDIAWEHLGEGGQQYWIDLPHSSGRLRLVRLRPGAHLFANSAPQEDGIAMMLKGTLRHPASEYASGDIIEWLQETPSAMAAEEDGICAIGRDEKAAKSDLPPLAQRRRLYSRLLQRRPRLSEMEAVRPAIAAGLALIAGVGIGWLLHGGSSPSMMAFNGLLQIQSSRLVAQGPLKTALETLPSGEEIVASVSGGPDYGLSIKMTFQNQDGNYCREYRIASQSSEHYAGIACRVSDQWLTKLQALIPPAPSASEQAVPAGADPAIYAVVSTLIQGDPLGKGEEAALLAKSWAN